MAKSSRTQQTAQQQPATQVQNTERTILYNDPKKVMESKRYIKSGVEYRSPAEVLTPVLNLLTATGGIVDIDADYENSNANADGTVNKSWGRVNIITTFHIDEETTYEVGIMTAMDIAHPKIKIYRGPKVRACLNLCIWHADDVAKFDYGNGVNMEIIGQYIDSVTKKIEESRRIMQALKDMIIPDNIVHEIIGKAVMEVSANPRTSVGKQSIMNGITLLCDDKSKYYYRQPGFNAWLLFNAFTEDHSKNNFFDIPDKARQTYELLKSIHFAPNATQGELNLTSENNASA